MANKKICFRFDVDTHKCSRVGIPNLLDLAKSKGVRFTFFINCGRSISFRHSLKAALFGGGAAGPSHPQLGPRRKFGNLEYLRCAIVNPRVLKYGEDAVRRAHREGHEIGLHGGHNHELWGRFVNDWSEDQIAEEIRWGLEQLKGVGITPTAFASPCAAGGERVQRVLGRFHEFKFISDDLAPEGPAVPARAPGPLNVPTRICGRGGVAYIEQLVAEGKSDEEIVNDFAMKLERTSRAVFYDHPYFAGDEALPLMEKLIDSALKKGFQTCTLTEIGTDYESHLSRPGA